MTDPADNILSLHPTSSGSDPIETTPSLEPSPTAPPAPPPVLKSGRPVGEFPPDFMAEIRRQFQEKGALTPCGSCGRTQFILPTQPIVTGLGAAALPIVDDRPPEKRTAPPTVGVFVAVICTACGRVNLHVVDFLLKPMRQNRIVVPHGK